MTMSQDPEDRRIADLRIEHRNAAQSLLAEFGAQLHGFDPGVTAYLESKPYRNVTGQGRGAFGENLSFTREEWKWLRPLLEELRNLRSNAAAVHDAQSQIEDSRSEARDLLGQLNKLSEVLYHKYQDCNQLYAELAPIRQASKAYGRFDGDAAMIIHQAQRDEEDLTRAAEEIVSLRDEIAALKAARGGQS